VTLRDGIDLSLDRLVALGRLAVGEARGGQAHSHSGGTAGRRRGQGADIYDLRPFQDGDDPRRLDPAATARSGRAQVRTHHEDVDRTLLLVADLRGPMLWGTQGRLRSVAAAEALALEGWRAIAAGARVGLHATRDGESVTLPPRPREAAMLDIAAALARLHAAALTDAGGASCELSQLLDSAVSRAKAGTEVVLATGFDDRGADFDAVAAAALRKCPLRVLLVQDRIETDPPRGIFPVRGPRGLRQVRLGRSDSLRHLQAIGIPTRILHGDGDPLLAARTA